MAADQLDLHRTQPKAQAPIYGLTARYGNYVFRFVGQLSAGGYFENEQQFFEHMKALGTHIRATLEQYAA
jgi:hypothetical protein